MKYNQNKNKTVSLICVFDRGTMFYFVYNNELVNPDVNILPATPSMQNKFQRADYIFLALVAVMIRI